MPDDDILDDFDLGDFFDTESGESSQAMEVRNANNDVRELEWKNALLDEWNACEAWAVEKAGEYPAVDSVDLESTVDQSMMADVAKRLRGAGDRVSKQRFNTAAEVKVALRCEALTWCEDPHVLELCCGMGHMWAWVYRDLPYHGVDKQFIFSPRICSLAPAEDWVEQNSLADYNFIDVDTFGSPWAMVDHVLVRQRTAPLVVVVTDGGRQIYKRGGKPDHLALCFGAQRGLGLAAGGSFYREYMSMVPAFMQHLAESTGRKVAQVRRGDNGRSGSDTNYWAFLLEAA